VVGANIGTAINPVIEGGRAGDPASRRLPVGNLVNRAAGGLLVLPFLPPIAHWLLEFEPNPSRMAADFHLLFNLGLAALFLWPLDGLAWLLPRLMPARPEPADPARPLYLDASALDAPHVALACAARETLHVGDIVESMLRQTMAALLTDDRKLVAQIARMDDAVDQLTEAVKLYVTKITRQSLDEADGRRAMDIIAF